MSRPRSPYLALEKRITRDDKGSIMSRWTYGRAVLDDPRKMSASGKSLRHGAIEGLIADAKAVGKDLTVREIQWRLQCARAYKTINEIRTAGNVFESWTDLRNAGFPAVEVDEPDLVPEDPDLDDITDAVPDEWEQLSLIPGFKSTVKVHGREVPLEEATVGDVVAYRDKYRRMHEGFGKTLALIEASVDTILDAANGDMDALVIDAWSRAVDGAAAVGDEPESERVA